MLQMSGRGGVLPLGGGVPKNELSSKPPREIEGRGKASISQ